MQDGAVQRQNRRLLGILATVMVGLFAAALSLIFFR
jgi:hypothetical protein